MKYLIPLFLFAAGVEGQSSALADSAVDSEVYGKSSVYNYLVEPLISLDEQWGHIVTHCSIVGEDLSQVIQTYDGLGSCIFDQVDVLSDEEKLQKNIVFHTQVEGQVFDLLFQWVGLSVQDILDSYLTENPYKLSNQITLKLLGDEQSLSDSLSYLILSELFKTSSLEDRQAVQTVSSFLLQNKIDVIRLNLVPYADGLLKVTLSFFNSHDVEFYQLEVITNYYPGSDEYFVTSIDQYQEEMNEK